MDNIKTQANYKKQQIETIKNYVTNTDTCRNQQLLAYFEEYNTTLCGRCDVCLAQNSNVIQTVTVTQAILNSLSRKQKSSRQLCDLPYPETEIITALQLLLDQKKITLTSINTYTLL